MANRTFTVKEVYVMPDKPWVIYTATDGIKYTAQKTDTIIFNLLQVGKEVTVNVKDQPSTSGNWRILNVVEASGQSSQVVPVEHNPKPAAEPPKASVDKDRSIERQVALKVAGELTVALITSKGVTDSAAVVKTVPLLYTMCLGCLTGEVTVEKGRIAEMMMPRAS